MSRQTTLQKLKTLFGLFNKKHGEVKGGGAANVLSAFATSGEYTDLANRPTDTGDIENDLNFVTQNDEAELHEIHSGLTGGPSEDTTLTVNMDGSGYAGTEVSGGGSFVVPYFNVDTSGRVTSVTNRTITFNASTSTSTYASYASYTAYNNYSNYYNYSNYNSYNNENYGNAVPSQCSSLPAQCKPTDDTQTFPT